MSTPARRKNERPTAHQWLWAEIERRFGADVKRELYEEFKAQSRAYQQLIWHPDATDALRYRCLVCDQEFSCAAFVAHAQVTHRWRLDDFRQCGYEFDPVTRVSTHEFALPRESSSFWLLRSHGAQQGTP